MLIFYRADEEYHRKRAELDSGVLIIASVVVHQAAAAIRYHSVFSMIATTELNLTVSPA